VLRPVFTPSIVCHHNASLRHESDNTNACPCVAGTEVQHLDRSRELVQSMDLKQSMLVRHGWSAPWLPGLWKMPDGNVFDLHPAQSSLLMSLQLYFERGVAFPYNHVMHSTDFRHAWEIYLGWYHIS
jgi:hypothetical protein